VEPEFSAAAHELVDWIANYVHTVGQYPVRARTAPGDITRAMAPHAPPDAEPLELILREAREQLLPGITHWQHPGFMGYFGTTGTTPGILAEMLTAALNVNGMIWATSPAATELEQVVMRWLAGMLGIGDAWFGQITDTASTSTLLALAAARDADPSVDARGRGLAGRADLPALRVYSSEFAHSSVDKAVMTLGIGHQNLVKIPVDERFRMRPDALASAIAADRAAGYRPIAIVATAGTTSVASIDPVGAIADVARHEHLWLHVDASYAGAAASAPEFRWVLDGVTRADSVVVNPHKWMGVPVGCSAFWVRNAESLRRAFTLVPEYLRTNAGDVLDYHDVGFQLGRPFRALKLWMVMRAYGVNGLAGMIREHCAMATQFADWVRAAGDWEIAAPVELSLVCFRYAPNGMSLEAANDANTQILETVNKGGRALLSHTKLDNRVVLRLAIGNFRTDAQHLHAAWTELQAAASVEM
jgi:aromatic-L-amino-acid decarboxylase